MDLRGSWLSLTKMGGADRLADHQELEKEAQAEMNPSEQEATKVTPEQLAQMLADPENQPHQWMGKIDMVAQMIREACDQDIAEDVTEKLRKGRLWKRHCRITHLNRIMGKDAPGTELTDDAGDTIYALILGQWLGSDGQCVTLTMDVSEMAKEAQET